MLAVLVIISFLLDGIISTTLQSDTYLWPLFSLLSLTLIFPYLNSSRKNINFLMIAGVIGLFYDIVYMNSLFLNTLIYVLLAFIVIKVFSVLPTNIANTYFVGVLLIAVYRVIIFLFLSFIQSIPFDLINLLNSILTSLLSNLVYISFGYLLLGIVARRYKTKKISRI